MPPDRPTRTPLRPRDAYAVFRDVPTRWSDNDVYGHVNNVVHYAWFDTVVNAHLVEAGAIDIRFGPVIGLVVESGCRYARAVAFPDVVTIGLRVAEAGRSSVHYELGLFAGGRDPAAAEGRFIHVYVDRESRRPVALPPALRREIEALRR